MREQYIKKVKKELSLPSKAKSEVLRDLAEMFDSAAEHGETEEQLIERLGSPEDFAAETQKQLGYNGASRKRKAELIVGMIALAVAVAVFIIYAVVPFSRIPADVGIIGGADGPTAIFVSNPSFDPTSLLPIIGFAAAIVALALFSKRLTGKKKIFAIAGIVLLCILLLIFAVYNFLIYNVLLKG